MAAVDVPNEAPSTKQHCVRAALVGAVLVLAVLFLYAPAFHYGYLVLDDDLYVSNNPHVLSGLTLKNIAWAFKETNTLYWHPVTFLSHMLDCQLFGANPGPHHLVSVLLHALNALVIFYLLQKATGCFWRSSLVAALFALHPLNVENVVWLAERKSLLSALFSLLAIASYGWYLQRPGLKRYGVVAGFFLLALMSKPSAVIVPLLLLLLDYWPLHRIPEEWTSKSWVAPALDKLPLLLMSAGSTALTIVGQRSSGALIDVESVPLGMRLEQAFVCIPVYLRKLFWPVDLAILYPSHQHWLPGAELIANAVVLVGISALAFRFSRARYIVAGWLFFLVSLLPVLGIVQAGSVVIADRFAYVPAIGIFVVLAWAGGDLVSHYASRYPRARPIGAAVALSVLVALGFSSRHYIAYWRSGVTLFSRAAEVEKAPNAIILVKLGDSLLAEGRTDEALTAFQRSCQETPTFDACHFNIGGILFTRNDMSGALRQFQIALKVTNNREVAVNSLVASGASLMFLGEFEEAEKQLDYALRLAPENQPAQRLMEFVRRREIPR
jgi:hypothetical protein